MHRSRCDRMNNGERLIHLGMEQRLAGPMEEVGAVNDMKGEEMEPYSVTPNGLR
ncbi:hypothetical protein HN51_039613, partial [Arachis hypogaea]